MSFDIRLPIGLLFLALGLVLMAWGLVSSPEIYRVHSLGVNINLGWGAIMALFGAVMLVLTAMAKRRGAGQA
jgi:hypothetical protein